MSVGKRFASPIKGKQATAKRAKTRDSTKDLADLRSSQSMALFCSVDNAKTPLFSFSVLQQRMFTPRTRFSRASSLGSHCVPLNRIYGTTWMPMSVKHLVGRFLHSL